jgi:hypothetical protein
MTIIEQIKAEIERRWKDYRNSVTPDQPKYRTHYFVGKGEVCEELLSFLSTLESEKPMNPEELEKDAVNYCFDNGLNLSPRVATDFARHFAQWGAEHLADARKTSPKDIEGAANEYEKKHTYQRYDGGGFTQEYDATLAEAVIFGAKWQKEQDEKGLSEKIAAAYQLGLADKEKQMMKNAKDGWIDEECVIVLNDGTRIDLQPDYDKKPAFEFEYAQDVRVVVLPKEDNYDARRKE